ncbi:MAG: OmpA family protein [Cyclobacteriaceae bacterium]|jgi:OOP family OmpA-OmpF porin
MKLFCILFLLAFQVSAQVREIPITGKVLNLSTGKAVKAKITYKSIPTGSISGTFYDSVFNFPVFGTAKYQITAQAEGFIPRSIIMDPREIGDRVALTRNIELTQEGKTFRLTHLNFTQGKAVIQPESFEELDELAALMNDNRKIVIQLEGHTDNLGRADLNLKLSEDRVEAVKKYLTGKGVGKDRIKTKAFGGTQPLSNDGTPEARALNRRVEIRVLED